MNNIVIRMCVEDLDALNEGAILVFSTENHSTNVEVMSYHHFVGDSTIEVVE